MASAGTEPKGVHPLAIRVMDEVGIDISGHTSDPVARYVDEDFDLVITICDAAREQCPVFPGARRVLHQAFEDPDYPELTEAELTDVFRRIRDQIAAFQPQPAGNDHMTRSLATAERIALLMEGIGSRAEGPGRVYLVGGATAAMIGWRDATVDADLKLDPAPAAVFETIAALKEELDINVELAAPDQFVPALPGWRERSRFIVRHGQVDFFHYDFYGQALAKIERGHDADLTDVRA